MTFVRAEISNAKSYDLSNNEEMFSWGKMTEKGYHACNGKMTTAHSVESPFAAVTCQL